MIGSLLYCAAKPVRLATCLDLSTVDQPSRVVTLLLCFVDVVWVVRIHGVHVSYFNKLCSNFIINRNHFWTGGLHPGSCALVKDSAGVKCTQCLFGGEPGATRCLPSDAVGAVEAQKDQTCNITSSFRVQPLTIWADRKRTRLNSSHAY